MADIHHRPILDIERVEKLYSEKDGVPIKYVCTTELISGAYMYDVYYRTDGSRHPVYGNRYFGLTDIGGRIYITNADKVENLKFATIEGHYSRHVHDYVNMDYFAIDGGRSYTKISGQPDLVVDYYRVRDGVFVPFDPYLEQNWN